MATFRDSHDSAKKNVFLSPDLVQISQDAFPLSNRTGLDRERRPPAAPCATSIRSAPAALPTWPCSKSPSLLTPGVQRSPTRRPPTMSAAAAVCGLTTIGVLGAAWRLAAPPPADPAGRAARPPCCATRSATGTGAGTQTGTSSCQRTPAPDTGVPVGRTLPGKDITTAVADAGAPCAKHTVGKDSAAGGSHAPAGGVAPDRRPGQGPAAKPPSARSSGSGHTGSWSAPPQTPSAVPREHRPRSVQSRLCVFAGPLGV